MLAKDSVVVTIPDYWLQATTVSGDRAASAANSSLKWLTDDGHSGCESADETGMKGGQVAGVAAVTMMPALRSYPAGVEDSVGALIH